MIITTTQGDIEEHLLEKRTGSCDSPTDTAHWIEYWKDGELVHRSVHLIIKELPAVAGDTTSFS